MIKLEYFVRNKNGYWDSWLPFGNKMKQDQHSKLYAKIYFRQIDDLKVENKALKLLGKFIIDFF